jgi:hypothetical protein
MMRNGAAPHIDFKDMAGKITEKETVLPSNIDFVLEKKGWFLFGEFKRPGESISVGQKIMLEALSLQPRTEVFIAEGHSDGGTLVVTAITTVRGSQRSTEACDADGFCKRVATWYADKERRQR